MAKKTKRPQVVEAAQEQKRIYFVPELKSVVEATNVSEAIKKAKRSK